MSTMLNHVNLQSGSINGGYTSLRNITIRMLNWINDAISDNDDVKEKSMNDLLLRQEMSSMHTRMRYRVTKRTWSRRSELLTLMAGERASRT